MIEDTCIPDGFPKNRITDAGHKAVRCDVCEKKLPQVTPECLKKTDLDIGCKPFRCHVCEKKFHCFQQECHECLKRSVDTGSKVFRCYICGKKFNQESRVSTHICEAHSPMIKTHFQCRIFLCGKYFSTDSDAIHHIKLMHAVGRRGWCELCGKHFSEKDMLSEHMIVRHTKLKPKSEVAPIPFLASQRLVIKKEPKFTNCVERGSISELKQEDRHDDRP